MKIIYSILLIVQIALIAATFIFTEKVNLSMNTLVFGASFVFGLYQLTVRKDKLAWIVFIIPLLILIGILLFNIIDPFKDWDKLFY